MTPNENLVQIHDGAKYENFLSISYHAHSSAMASVIFIVVIMRIDEPVSKTIRWVKEYVKKPKTNSNFYFLLNDKNYYYHV